MGSGGGGMGGENNDRFFYVVSEKDEFGNFRLSPNIAAFVLLFLYLVSFPLAED